MLDGAPAHTPKLIKEWFEFVAVDYIQDWPGNCPDFNPIENLWGLIKRRLRGCDTTTLPKLVKEIQDIWDNLEPTMLQRLAESVPRRLESCLKRKGLPTKY